MALLATVGFASCDGDYDDYVSPASNPQEAAAAKYGLSYTAGPEATTVLPNDADGIINLVGVNYTETGDTTFETLTINGIQVSANHNVAGDYITTPATEVARAIYEAKGSRVAEATPLDVTTKFTVALGDGQNLDVTGTTAGTATPWTLPTPDASGYYITGVTGSPVQMTANGDGTYSAQVQTNTTTSSNSHFLINSSSDENFQVGAVSEDLIVKHGIAAYTGDPVYSAGPKEIAWERKAILDVTFDPTQMTYDVHRAPTVYYVRGRFAANASKNPRQVFFPEGNNTYSFTAEFTSVNDLKFQDIPNYGGSIYLGASAANSDANVKGTEGTLAIGATAGYISSPDSGWYKLTIDMENMTYNLASVTAPTKEYETITLTGINRTLHRNNIATHTWFLNNIRVTSATTFTFAANDGTVWGAAEAGKSVTSNHDVFGTGTNAVTIQPGTYSFYLDDVTGQFLVVPQN